MLDYYDSVTFFEFFRNDLDGILSISIKLKKLTDFPDVDLLYRSY